MCPFPTKSFNPLGNTKTALFGKRRYKISDNIKPIKRIEVCILLSYLPINRLGPTMTLLCDQKLRVRKMSNSGNMIYCARVGLNWSRAEVLTNTTWLRFIFATAKHVILTVQGQRMWNFAFVTISPTHTKLHISMH